MSIFSFNSELAKVTGVQKVLMDVHHALSERYDTKVLGTISYSEVRDAHGIKRNEYVKMKNPFSLYNSIVILHERKYLLLFKFIRILLLGHLKIVYVHHSLLYGQKLMTSLPKNIVAISDKGIENLTDYFHAPVENITKIHNCVVDTYPPQHKAFDSKNITILYPARINEGKRQIEIFKRLKDKIDPRVKIIFAGDGPLLDTLQKELGDNKQFISTGYINDIQERLSKVDYMMLFSTFEGLPISLIEACMTGCPIITNNVGGNPEIVDNGKNGFVLEKDDWDGLITLLNRLPEISKEDYITMSKSGRKKYEQEFTFDQFKKKYLDLIENL